MARVTGEQVIAALAVFEARIGLTTWPVDMRTRLDAMCEAIEAAAAAPMATGGDILRVAVPTGPALAGGIVSRCHARREGDEMACGRCGLRWQAGDEDPPVCAPVERRIGRRRA